MFNWFKKNPTPEYKTLVTEIQSVKDEFQIQNKHFGEFVTKLEGHFVNMDKNAAANNNWLREFNRLVMQDYVSGPRRKVYSFLYVLTKTNERRMILVARDKFEEAHLTANEVMQSQNANMREWLMESYQSLDIPLEPSESAVKKIDEMTVQERRPIESYLDCLRLAQARFCETPQEKKTISGIINKVKKEYYAPRE